VINSLQQIATVQLSKFCKNNNLLIGINIAIALGK